MGPMKSEFPESGIRRPSTARAVTVSIGPGEPDPRILLSAATIIRQGGLVAYPTETVYGLGADPFNAAAIDRLRSAKGRDAESAMILILAQTGEAHDLALLAGPARRWFEALTLSFWPGPLTLVLPARPRLNCPALAGGSTVAVRLSSHPVARQLVRTVGRPITSTSANRSGSPPAVAATDLEEDLAGCLDMILDSGPAPGGPASTILDLSGERPRVLREGALAAELLAGPLGMQPRALRRARTNLQ